MAACLLRSDSQNSMLNFGGGVQPILRLSFSPVVPMCSMTYE